MKHTSGFGYGKIKGGEPYLGRSEKGRKVDYGVRGSLSP
jgi:hypothetical protein